MPDIDRLQSADRRGLELLYRRTFGIEAAAALGHRWDWLRRNPANTGPEPLYWIVREGPTVIATSLVTPVRVGLRGLETDGIVSSDPLVIGERQRRGLGEALLRHWDRQSGVALGLGLSEGTHYLLRERLRWPKPITLPCVVKPLSRRALRQPSWPVMVNRLVSALTLPIVRIVARARPMREHVEVVRRFDTGVDRLWERVAPRLDLAVKRNAAYLNWRFVDPPHVRYAIALLRREDETHGYAIYRHVREPQGKATHIVDFLADPEDERGVKTLLRWIDREARAEDSDKIRCYVKHTGFRRVLRRSGYFVVKSQIDAVVKVNAVDVPAEFHAEPDRWHLTLSDVGLDQ